MSTSTLPTTTKGIKFRKETNLHKDDVRAKDVALDKATVADVQDVRLSPIVFTQELP